MNIGQVVLNLDIGGLEKMALDLALAEKRAGHNVFIYSVTHPGALAQRAESLGIPVRSFHKTHGFSPRVVFSMARQFSRDRLGIVHSHNAVIHHYGAIAGRLARVPVIVNTQHGLAGLSKPHLMRFFGAVAPITDAVVFVAAETEARFREQALSLPRIIRQIPNGIDLGPFLNAPAMPGSLRPRFRIGTIGRMAPVKDHANLLHAFHRLQQKLPESELHIMGYGELREATLALAREIGIEGSFFLHAPDSSVPEFLRNLDVFAISSRSEALPISLLEAMAAGLPVVSTRVGGIPDVARENDVAWFCSPGNSEQLCAILEAAAAASDLAERGQRAQRTVFRDYSADRMANRYLSLAEEILARKGHKTRTV